MNTLVHIALIAALLCCTPRAARAVPSGAVDPSTLLEPAADAEPASTPPEVLPDGALYRIGAGDDLTVQVYGEESLTGTYTVSTAGVLDFPLIGIVPVDGMTTASVGARLRARLMEGFLNNPHVTVSVSAYGSQPVQVLGAVSSPGLYFLQGPTTVLDMLSLAGGLNTEGVNEVRITRGGDDGETFIMHYEQLLAQTNDPFILLAGDVVFVPQSLVSVMGSVSKPGELTFREGLTVSRSIAAVGGALPTANLRKVYILRGDQRIRVNVKRILDGTNPDVPLLAGDQVFINVSVF